MFSREDAKNLRESLTAICFQAPISQAPISQAPNSQASHFQAPASRSELLQSYCSFYGLNFGNSQQQVNHSIGYLASGEYTLVCQHFQVPLAQQRGTLFLVHGYFDHAGLYSNLIEHCLGAGFSVVVFDLPGHGLSSGREASIGSFRQYSAALLACLDQAQQQQLHGPWLIIGQSTGAAVIMDALLEDALATRHSFAVYILLAPLLRPRRWAQSKLLLQVTRWFMQSTRRKFARNSHDPEFLNFLRNSDALQSKVLQRDWVLAMIDFQRRFARAPQSDTALQILQGSGDGTVDWEYNLPQILARFPRSKTYMIADAGHHLVNEAQPYRDRVFTLLDEIFNAAVD